MRPGRAADHSSPSSAAATSTHPLGHTGPVTGTLHLYLFFYHHHHNYIIPLTSLRTAGVHTVSLTKQHFIIAQTIRRNKIPPSLRSWLPTKNAFCQNTVYHVRIACPYISVNHNMFKVDPLRIGQVYSVCCKTTCRWVTTNCYHTRVY